MGMRSRENEGFARELEIPDPKASSWKKTEEIVKKLESACSPEALAQVEAVELDDEESIRRIAKELYDFNAQFFGADENISLPTMELILRKRLSQIYLYRDQKGSIVSSLQTQNIEVPNEAGTEPEMLFTVWYVATHSGYKGKPVTRELMTKAAANFLKVAKDKNQGVVGFIGETAPKVESLNNRYYHLRRLYIETVNNEAKEIAFMDPPEDESREGIPEHLMYRPIDDRNEITTAELMRLVRAIHSQYYRDEYFTVDHLKREDEHLGLDPKKVTVKSAQKFHDSYRNLTISIGDDVEKSLAESKDGKVHLLTSRDRRKLRSEGMTIFDWTEEGWVEEEERD